MKKINHYISALIVAAMTAGFSSCSSSDEPSSVSDNTPKELTITIKTQGVTTKAAETSDPATLTPNPEYKMNRITIGIFDNAGTTVRAIQEFTPSSGASEPVGAGNYYFNQSNNSATFTVVTTKMESTDKILVAVNAPAKHFAGVSNVIGFKAKQLTADAALYRDINDQTLSSGSAVNYNIPMYGESTTISNGTGTTFSATISVKHLTAKVTLQSLKVDFAADGPYSQASFTPTEIFLYSVPDGLQFNDSDPYIASPSNYFTGETTPTGTTITSVKNYLSTGTLTGSELSTSSPTFSNQYYFYTTPNSNRSDKKTKLVIKGTFKTNSSDVGSTKFYPVKLNSNVLADGSHSAAEGSTYEYQVYPNKNYQCSVVIKTIGSTGPDVDIDPTTAEISITVKDWDPISQTTVFQ